MSSAAIVCRFGLKSAGARPGIIFLLIMVHSADVTDSACDSVVPSAAPTGPSFNAPMKKTSSAIFAAQAIATKTIGLLLSPMPRKIELMMLYAVIHGMPMKQTVR